MSQITDRIDIAMGRHADAIKFFEMVKDPEGAVVYCASRDEELTHAIRTIINASTVVGDVPVEDDFSVVCEAISKRYGLDSEETAVAVQECWDRIDQEMTGATDGQ